MPIREPRLAGQIIESRFASKGLIPLRGLVPRRWLKISTQRSLLSIKPSRFFYQTQEAIVRDVLGRFCRTEHAVSKPKNRIAVTLVKNLKRLGLAVGCLFQQPLV